VLRDDAHFSQIVTVFTNEVQGPIGRTAFRAQVWRPSLVRAGFIGDVRADGKGFLAVWRD
jgi:hypothetical protein